MRNFDRRQKLRQNTGYYLRCEITEVVSFVGKLSILDVFWGPGHIFGWATRVNLEEKKFEKIREEN